MKKILTLGIATMMALSVVTGCSPKVVDNPKPPVETPENQVVNTGVVRAGLGIVSSIEKSKDKSETGATAQVDSVIVAAGFDKDGKVLSVTIDTAQNKVAFDKDMVLTSDLKEVGKTKVELGADYGMAKVSTLNKEWFEQIAELEKWMVGKTVEEVKGMNLKESVPDVEELKSSVTIKVDGYIGALEKAYNNAVEVADGTTVGLGHEISIAKSKSMKDDVLAVAQVDTTVAGTVLDKDGKVVATIIDVAQTKVNFDKDGVVISDKTAGIKSKKELGNDYGMKSSSAIGKEWFEQAKSLEDWTVGKTVEEIVAMKISDAGAPDEEELKSTVSIKVGGYLNSIKEAVEKAK